MVEDHRLRDVGIDPGLAAELGLDASDEGGSGTPPV